MFIFSGESSCDTFDDQVVERALQLGVLCGEPGQEGFFFGDLFFECGQDNSFENVGGSNFTCFSPPTIIPANADNTLFAINTTEIMTDYRWPLHTPDNCYTFDGSRRLSKRGISESEISHFLTRARVLGKSSSFSSENHDRVAQQDAHQRGNIRRPQ